MGGELMDAVEEISILVDQLRQLDQWHELLAFWPLPQDQEKIAAMNDRFWERGTEWGKEPDLIVKTAVLDAYHEALETAVKAICNGMARSEGTPIYQTFRRTTG